MPTVSCPKCPKTFTKPTIARAQQALLMHDGRTHTRAIPTAIGSANAGSRAYRERHANAAVGLPEIVEAKPARKPYTRRAKVITEVAVNFCPNCSCDLKAVAMGIAMGNQAKV